MEPSVDDLNKLKLTKQVLTGYITAPLSAAELELVNNIRSSNVLLHLTEAFTLWDREEDLKECMPKLVPASWLQGLINLVPNARAGDKSERYCIGNLVMDMFTELLYRWQHTYPKLCWMLVILHNEVHISGITWNSFKPAPQADLCYVFMPLLETIEGHWLLLVAELSEGHFLVYDSLLSPAHKNRRELLDSAMILDMIAVFVMAYMDLLSVKADGYHFDQDCVAHYKDKCLLSFLHGRVAHFP
ncbi:hypothetical protein Cgig2_008265 [Carnegiea gigantea]|uniref:Ubiquitin-like protease family profile domain-containing protein n=1 Tax=Carnegiea gigantea TaxID=171969 RepID=A0A9Q1L2V5_9CARY|nr:hypothetical protein Cgig2_008265 [Carnegiea gigantea]